MKFAEVSMSCFEPPKYGFSTFCTSPLLWNRHVRRNRSEQIKYVDVSVSCVFRAMDPRFEFRTVYCTPIPPMKFGNLHVQRSIPEHVNIDVGMCYNSKAQI